MKLLVNLVNILNKPFPEQESNFGAPKTLALISLFITFFLYIFEPFGISTLESGKFWICLGFGSMTFLASVIYEFIVSRVLKLKGELENWTFGKWILNNFGLLLAISLANFLFVRIAVFGFIQWELFPHMIYGTFMVGIIPILALGWFSLLIQEKKYQNLAENINQRKSVHTNKQIDDGHYIFDIQISRIKYVEALQNYVSIGYVNPDGQFDKKIERATLKHVMEKISGSSIIQSHRSFLVNQNAIISTSGNAQGLVLNLSDSDKTVPVSRSFVPVFRGE